MMALFLLKGSLNYYRSFKVLLNLILELKQTLGKDIQAVYFKISILDLIMPLSACSGKLSITGQLHSITPLSKIFITPILVFSCACAD